MFECECGVKLSAPKLPVYCRCGRIHRDSGVTHRDDPPAWVIALRRLRNPSDRGVGDTVQRVAAWMGGELFKKLAAKLGIPCGCTQRQGEWNARWPYDAH